MIKALIGASLACASAIGSAQTVVPIAIKLEPLMHSTPGKSGMCGVSFVGLSERDIQGRAFGVSGSISLDAGSRLMLKAGYMNVDVAIKDQPPTPRLEWIKIGSAPHIVPYEGKIYRSAPIFWIYGARSSPELTELQELFAGAHLRIQFAAEPGDNMSKIFSGRINVDEALKDEFLSCLHGLVKEAGVK